MREEKRSACMTLLATLGVAVLAFIGGVIALRLWNWLPPLFGWREISCWHALGLLALCCVLCGAFRRSGCGRICFLRRAGGRGANPIPEEGERFAPGSEGRWR